MAYKTSDLYKKRVFSSDPLSNIRIKMNGEEIDYNYLKELKLDDSCFESENFALGSAIIQTVKLTMDNRGFKVKPEDITSVSIDYGQILEDGTTEWIPIGIYDVGKEPDTSAAEYTKFTLYDYMNRLDINYDGSDVVPCTRYELYQDICKKCNVEVGSDSFINGDVQVDVYDNTITARNYIQFLAERAGGYAKIDRNGKLCIHTFSDADVITLTEDEEDLIELEDYDSLKTITGVTYENAVNKWSFGDDTGEVVFLSDENVFVCSEAEVENIYNALNGLHFQSANFKMLVDPAWDTGDIIKFMGKQTFIQKSSWNYNMGFIGNIKTTLNSSKKMSNVQKISTPNKIKRLHALLDEESGKIELLTQKTDGNTSEIANLTMETDNIKTSLTEIDENMTEKLSEVTQTAESIISSIQITGGSNMINNSVRLFGNSLWNDSETGTIFGGYDQSLVGKTVSASKLQLSNANTTTTNDNITNIFIGETYTLSYKASNDENTTLKIRLLGNDTIYEQEISESIELQEYSFTFVADTANLVLEISSTSLVDTGTSLVTDLMLAKGDKTSWEPASGEISSTVMKFYKLGLIIYGAGSNTAVMLGSQGLDIRNYSRNEIGDRITYFDADGTKTKTLECTEIYEQELVNKKITIGSSDFYVRYIKD
ncbi:MAG TPA: hypothetical protein IAB27_05175 [Candidatus Coprosoma intestinipullorum]|uniref:Uncharacterized protein n=1 Tax=Candidatus Coprosoma intestinipullorum TaxID=2840752 RepID=A0A9D0ZRL5_9FIRM|nr:hypothetical protein [Candidatus Coprosoma intestinipullorum]